MCIVQMFCCIAADILRCFLIWLKFILCMRQWIFVQSIVWIECFALNMRHAIHICLNISFGRFLHFIVSVTEWNHWEIIFIKEFRCRVHHLCQNATNSVCLFMFACVQCQRNNQCYRQRWQQRCRWCMYRPAAVANSKLNYSTWITNIHLVVCINLLYQKRLSLCKSNN